MEFTGLAVLPTDDSDLGAGLVSVGRGWKKLLKMKDQNVEPLNL